MLHDRSPPKLEMDFAHEEVEKCLAENRQLHYQFNPVNEKETFSRQNFIIPKKKDKIDNFESKELLKQMIDVKIPEFEDWIEHSDHVPLNITFS